MIPGHNLLRLAYGMPLWTLGSFWFVAAEIQFSLVEWIVVVFLLLVGTVPLLVWLEYVPLLTASREKVASTLRRVGPLLGVSFIAHQILWLWFIGLAWLHELWYPLLFQVMVLVAFYVWASIVFRHIGVMSKIMSSSERVSGIVSAAPSRYMELRKEGLSPFRALKQTREEALKEAKARLREGRD